MLQQCGSQDSEHFACIAVQGMHAGMYASQRQCKWLLWFLHPPRQKGPGRRLHSAAPTAAACGTLQARSCGAWLCACCPRLRPLQPRSVHTQYPHCAREQTLMSGMCHDSGNHHFAPVLYSFHLTSPMLPCIHPDLSGCKQHTFVRVENFQVVSRMTTDSEIMQQI